MTPVGTTTLNDRATPPHVRVLGVRVDVVTEAVFLALVAQWAGDRTPRQVVTINPEFVMRAHDDARFAAVLEAADLATPDGVGVIWAARRQGLRVPERVGGASVALPLARQCAQRGHRLFLLGAAEGVAAEAACRLQQQVPDLVIAGTYAGSPDPGADEEAVARVRAAAPDVLLVAYGSPHQEFWIARNKERLGVPVSLGVGGTLDYLAGRQRRAPALLQRPWLGRGLPPATQPRRRRRAPGPPRGHWAP